MSFESAPSPAVTRLLAEASAGHAEAAAQLLQVVYAELHEIARRHMRGERPSHTLQPTALVNEAVLRLFGDAPPRFEDRTHFLRVASRVMRRVLVDHARARAAAKRDGGVRVTLDEELAGGPGTDVDLLALDEALERLGAAEPRRARVVELRWLMGLEVGEVAQVLGASESTVKRDWQFARAWLAHALEAGPDT